MKRILRAAFCMIMVALASVSCNKNDSKTEDCNLIADQHWSRERYSNWLIETYGIASDTLLFQGEGGEPTHFLHHLSPTNTPGYYEMIGEFDQFQYGWDDTDYLRGDSLSAYRDQYLQCRSRL
jgi:hypothetical protein